MTDLGRAAPLLFPHPEPPATGTPVAVADGIEWVRLPLPFRLDHVNVFLIEDEGGVAVVDTGIGDETTRALWDALLDGPLRRRRITRIIATHFHPDHVGMAGWLAERTGSPLLMSQAEYLTCLTIQLDPEAANAGPYRDFYLAHGLDPAVADELLTNGHRYLRMITGLPRTFRRLIAGEALHIGRRGFDVLSGGGHSPEQIMLHCPADGLLLAADQVLARISPNISVQANDPEGDPLGIYLRSLAALKDAIPAGTLVLPGHNLPFIGLHARVDELASHHALRCDAIAAACRDRRLSAAELVPVVFGRVISDPHQMGFAFSEALAHANLLLRQGRLAFEGGRYRTTMPAERPG